jgi:DNA-directed RNA polymerase subunit RPC12/RpoP
MAYLRCPDCGVTIFDRNPLSSPLNCPRCARRALAVELERVPKVRGTAAASVLSRPTQPVQHGQ